MRQQGCCTLSPDEAGRVLDRLAGLEKVIPTAVQRQVLLDTERVNPRSCPLTHEVMLWVVLAMGIFTDASIRHVFKMCRRFRERERSPARSSLCEARQRLGVEPVAELHRRVVRLLATPETPGAFYHEFRCMAFDGSVFDAPDSDANGAVFERANGRASGNLRSVAGTFRHACLDVRSRPTARARSGPIVVHRLPTHPALPIARMRHGAGHRSGVLVPSAPDGVASGTNRATTQPNQPSRCQTQDVQIRQETARTSRNAAAHQNLCGISSYHLTERYCG